MPDLLTLAAPTLDSLTRALDATAALATAVDRLTTLATELQTQLATAKAEGERLTAAFSDLDTLHQRLAEDQQRTTAAVDKLAVHFGSVGPSIREGLLADYDAVTSTLADLAGGITSAPRQRQAVVVESAALLSSVVVSDSAANRLATRLTDLGRDLAGVSALLEAAADEVGATPLTREPEPVSVYPIVPYYATTADVVTATTATPPADAPGGPPARADPLGDPEVIPTLPARATGQPDASALYRREGRQKYRRLAEGEPLPGAETLYRRVGLRYRPVDPVEEPDVAGRQAAALLVTPESARALLDALAEVGRWEVLLYLANDAAQMFPTK